jgi:methyl-accepting chemotaxis protein PixJ
MINKTDTAHTGDANNKASMVASSPINDKKMEIIGQSHIKTANNYPGKNVIRYLRQLKLSTKAVIFSIVIGTLPVLVINISLNKLSELKKIKPLA